MEKILITEFMDAESVDLLRKEFDVTYNPDLWNNRSELDVAVGDCAALIVRNRTQVDSSLIELAANLKVVGRLGVGLDNIDTSACADRNIAVHPATGANANSVAEYVVAVALLLVRGRAYFASPQLTAGQWPREELGKGAELAGNTLGIIGLGSIGSTVARKARALDLEIIAHDPYLPSDHDNWQLATKADIDGVLSAADIVTIHGPLSSETAGMIGAGEISRMKKGAILINTARGGIVDQSACATALRRGHLAGAALDVFDDEPITLDQGKVFSGIDNVILTPHISGVTREANSRVSKLTALNVAKALGRQLA
ncbi:MAG: hydroxyacid dehydrogenase [Hyphomicrobiaceae bacterium]